MKSALTKSTAFILVLSFLGASTYFSYPPPPVQASGKAVACAAGYITAGLSALVGLTQNILGVSQSQFGGTAQGITTGGSVNALSFNECILKPLAKIMIITIIRNIGASVVNWVNTGFEGKPAFVTNFNGILLDAADQSVGQFIEGSELGFLCNSFSFQIRLALALKYSQPYRERARCTLTNIAGNVSNFANNNGGAGWDNWLRVTTEPQNNIYGAYLIAETELAERAARAVDIKEKRIAIGQGFLDFETCDEYETPAEVRSRQTTGVTAQPGANFVSAARASPAATGGPTSFGSFSSVQAQPGSGVTRATNGQTFASQSTQFISSVSSKPKCKKSTTKTPGAIIAGKLNSEFAMGDIQKAVATEIDDVIAATMNQLAQKMMSGASGLLGLSQKKSASSQSYIERYQSQFYGIQETTSENIGATSPLEDYTVTDFNAGASLVAGSSQVVAIYDSTVDAAAEAIDRNREQQTAINSAVGAGQTTERNLAFYMSAYQSSSGRGGASNAVNGVKDGNTSQYNLPAETGEEQNPWWEVDLGKEEKIDEVRIWKVTNKPVSQTLERIRIVASNGAGTDVWESAYITGAGLSANPIVIAVDKTRRYVRIEKQGTLDTSCRDGQGFGELEYVSCYHPLEFVEAEVIGTIQGTTGFGTTVATSSPSGAPRGTDDRTATSTVAWVVANPIDSLSANAPFTYELRLTAGKTVSELKIRSTLLRNDTPVPFLSIFSEAEFRYGKSGGQTSTYTMTSPSIGTLILGNAGADAGGYYFLVHSGTKKPTAPVGAYTIETTVEDRFGTILKTQVSNFVVQ